MPAIKNWPELATNDLKQIEIWDKENPDYNVAVTLEGKAVIDIDIREGKNGIKSIEELKKQGIIFPKTYTQRTPSGGYHAVYSTYETVKQSVSKVGSGIDIKAGKGGYIVFSGSTTKHGIYSDNGQAICPITDQLTALLGRKAEKKEKIKDVELIGDTPKDNVSFVKRLLENAEPAIQFQGGDAYTFHLICRLRDHNVTRQDALDLLLDHWNDRCEPPWTAEELKVKVDNAYNYAQLPMGNQDPKVVFEAVEKTEKLDPIETFNKDHAFVSVGGHARILRESYSKIDGFRVDMLTIDCFKSFYLPTTMADGEGKKVPLAERWLKSPKRRTYDGVCFAPNQDDPKRYNHWRGFTITEPNTEELFPKIAHDAVKLYLEHVFENISSKDEGLYAWIMDFLAHLIQKPEEKAKVALVLKGRKGVGKNFFIETIGKMLGAHFQLTSERRYLLGNFNSHYENNLMMVLDEAFWSGDKPSEGKLKDLVTGEKHKIEHKGLAHYDVTNLTRVVILGNEDWLVPASDDERRYTVCNVGVGKMQNTHFFETIQKGMDLGGLRLLFKVLKERDISKWNRFVAYETEALAEQKIESLSNFRKWWYESLCEEKILHLEGNAWPVYVEKEEFFRAFKLWVAENTGTKWLPSQTKIKTDLRSMAPSLSFSYKRKGNERIWMVKIPVLEQARKEWDQFMKIKTKWNQDVAEEIEDAQIIPIDSHKFFN